MSRDIVLALEQALVRAEAELQTHKNNVAALSSYEFTARETGVFRMDVVAGKIQFSKLSDLPPPPAPPAPDAPEVDPPAPPKLV